MVCLSLQQCLVLAKNSSWKRLQRVEGLTEIVLLLSSSSLFMMAMVASYEIAMEDIEALYKTGI